MLHSRKASLSRQRWRLRLLNHHLPLAFMPFFAVIVLYLALPRRDATWKLSMATAYVGLFLHGGDIGVVSYRGWPQCPPRGSRVASLRLPEGAERLFPLRHDQFGFANDTAYSRRRCQGL